MVTLLRGLFGDHVLTNPMVKSAAVSDAGITKQTLYEIGRESMTRSTYDRALEALDAVNGEIASLIASHGDVEVGSCQRNGGRVEPQSDDRQHHDAGERALRRRLP